MSKLFFEPIAYQLVLIGAVHVVGRQGKVFKEGGDHEHVVGRSCGTGTSLRPKGGSGRLQAVTEAPIQMLPISVSWTEAWSDTRVAAACRDTCPVGSGDQAELSPQIKDIPISELGDISQPELGDLGQNFQKSDPNIHVRRYLVAVTPVAVQGSWQAAPATSSLAAITNPYRQAPKSYSR